MEEIYLRLRAKIMELIAQRAPDQPLVHLDDRETVPGYFQGVIDEFPGDGPADHVIEVARREMELFHKHATGVHVTVEDEDVYRFIFNHFDQATRSGQIYPWLLKFYYAEYNPQQLEIASRELETQRERLGRVLAPNAFTATERALLSARLEIRNRAHKRGLRARFSPCDWRRRDAPGMLLGLLRPRPANFELGSQGLPSGTCSQQSESRASHAAVRHAVFPVLCRLSRA